MHAGLKTLSLFGVATVLSLLAAECAARLLLPRAWNLQNVATFGDLKMASRWPGLPYRLKPGASQLKGFRGDPRGYFDPGPSLTYRINSLGFRGPETTLAKPTGHLRVVGLGDSFTFGWGVRVEDTFLAVLGDRLASDAGSQPVEVLNLGVMGYAPQHEAVLLRFLGTRLSPDLVVLCFFLNDAGAGQTASFFNERVTRDAWWRVSRLADQVVFQLGRHRRARNLIADYQRSFAPDAAGWIEAQAGLRQVAALSRSHGFDLVMMIFPVLWELSGEYPFEGIHETVAATGEELGIPVLDLLPAFAGREGPELWVEETDEHPNEIAHAIAGEALHQFLVERGLPRPRVTP